MLCKWNIGGDCSALRMLDEPGVPHEYLLDRK